MKTRLFGLACALASAAAAAQTSGVTLYGVVDANVEYTNHNLGSGSSGQSRVALNSGGLSPSRWGLRGTEDLGGGKRAILPWRVASAWTRAVRRKAGGYSAARHGLASVRAVIR